MRRRGSSTTGRATGRRPFPACTPPFRPAATPSPAVADEDGGTAAADDRDTSTPSTLLGACLFRRFLFLQEEHLSEGGGGGGGGGGGEGGDLSLVRAAIAAAAVAGVPAEAADDSVPVVRPRWRHRSGTGRPTSWVTESDQQRVDTEGGSHGRQE